MTNIKRDPTPKLSYIVYLEDGSTHHTKPAHPNRFPTQVREDLRALKANGWITADQFKEFRYQFTAFLLQHKERMQDLREIEYENTFGQPPLKRGRPKRKFDHAPGKYVPHKRGRPQKYVKTLTEEERVEHKRAYQKEYRAIKKREKQALDKQKEG